MSSSTLFLVDKEGDDGGGGWNWECEWGWEKKNSRTIALFWACEVDDKDANDDGGFEVDDRFDDFRIPR